MVCFSLTTPVPSQALDTTDRRRWRSIYPELMAELDAIKRQRIGGLMLCRD
jgi:hypothetical protein